MAPPTRRAAQAEQPRRLRRDAVGRHQLLLLSDRTEEAKGMDAEADYPERRQRGEADEHGDEEGASLACSRRGEHEEWKHDPGAQLHADAGNERRRGRSRTGLDSGGEGEGSGQREQ
jgi:hypothetical protein